MQDKIAELIVGAKNIVIVQADNPDADSLGSALALEQILGDLHTEPHLYCGVDIPSYLRYLAGWDRVSNELPVQFDLSIIVDASTMTLLEKLQLNNDQGRLAAKPCIILDHHEEVSNLIPFATTSLNDVKASSTGEVIYTLAKQLKWPLAVNAQELLLTAVLGDTQGLSNAQTKAHTYRMVANIIDAGVDRTRLEERRRELSKMSVAIFKYKAKLLERTEFVSDNRIAMIVIPNDEISEFSPQYNPKMLVQYEMLQTQDVQMSVVFKVYGNGRITAAIRCNTGAPIAHKLAEQFGGGGHPFASGFKVQDGRDFNDVKAACIAAATKLLDTIKKP
jgi:phosphoesterase RecJ-like protein